MFTLCGFLSQLLRKDEAISSHLSSPTSLLTHLLKAMDCSESVMKELKSIQTQLTQLEEKSKQSTSSELSSEHLKITQEAKAAIKGFSDRLTPLEGLHRTMVSSNSKLNANVEVMQKSIDEMNRKAQQQEAQIRSLKTQLEQRTVANSWDSLSHRNTSQENSRFIIIEKKYEDLERQVASLKVHVSELELQLQASLASTHNGSFLWRIPDLGRRKRDAIEEQVTSIYSPPFYTGRNGYKMCIRAYLNGDGMGYKTHLSLFFVLMKGEYDPLLKWPFDHKVSLILVDQSHRKHIVQTFKPTVESSSFQRPVSDMNVASGCPQFSKLSALDDENYVKDDVIFIKCIVDTSRIFHP